MVSCRLLLGRHICQLVQVLRNIQQSPAIVIGGLPDASLIGVGWDTVGPDHFVRRETGDQSDNF
jgi:hypothetical protein